MRSLKAPIRMVALDLDGTVLNRSAEITPRTREAIAAAARKGVVVLPATGRDLSGVPLALAEIPGVRYAITSNGAAAWDLGEDAVGAIRSRYSSLEGQAFAQPRCIIRHLLSAEAVRAAYPIYRSGHGGLSIFRDGRSYRDERDAAWSEQHGLYALSTEAKAAMRGRFYIYPDLTPWLAEHDHEIEKFCMFFDDMDDLAAVQKQLVQIPDTELAQGSPDNLEITAAGVDKGRCLLELGQLLGIPRESILAIGDSDNDRAMLRQAGVAAVMANGMPRIKELADIVSENDCDHDGVAELLETLVL